MEILVPNGGNKKKKNQWRIRKPLCPEGPCPETLAEARPPPSPSYSQTLIQQEANSEHVQEAPLTSVGNHHIRIRSFRKNTNQCSLVSHKCFTYRNFQNTLSSLVSPHFPKSLPNICSIMSS